jgi:gamma-glutamyltranspeptidase / glutathione hydrolase
MAMTPRIRVRALAAMAALPLLLGLQSCRSGVPTAAAASPASPASAHVMVVAANPLAAQAGLAVLRAGGSAADAAVAVQAVLGLVEPQSSGLGGGAFITYYDARSSQVLAYNGRETAPAAASADMFLGADGTPLPFPTAVLSGRSTGVPGALAALELLQREHGRLAWRDLFGDARRLATEGFTVSPRLAGMIASRAPQASAPDAVHYFSKPDGTRLSAGDLLKNPAYAETLKRLASQGTRALYVGPIANDIVQRVHQGEYPGSLSLEDLARYRPIESAALCRPWLAYVVCTPPLPSGGVGVLQGLMLLADTDIAQRGPEDPIAWVELGEAERLMYADRNFYVGDPTFVAVPLAGLLDPGYVQGRAAQIGERVAATPPHAGVPPGASPRATDQTIEPGGTTHFIIVDAAGNVVSMTTTVESLFGSGRMVDGFFLNNQLTDFSFSPLDGGGQPAANAVAAGKRPRSAMSPTIVLDGHGHFVAAAGSAGGPAIISYVLKTLIAALDWHLSMRAAVSLPNLVAHGANFSGEAGKFGPTLLEGLNARGLDVHAGQYEESGLTGVQVLPDGSLDGGADPRREGVAIGY